MKQSITITLVWVALISISIGFVAGRIWTPSGIEAMTAAGTPAPDATATRAAELIELEQLRTQVAQSGTVCVEPTSTSTPSPTTTPTPVAPVATGQPLVYGENWTVQVTSAASASGIEDSVPTGVFIVVNLTITNDEPAERFFPVEELTLLDDQGRVFVADQFVSSHVWIDQPINFQFEPNLPIDTAVVFDVATDAGTNFILESTADPTFRVQVSLEVRG